MPLLPMQMIAKLPFFHGETDMFVAYVLDMLQPEYYQPGDFIFEEVSTKFLCVLRTHARTH
jgi:hypothetical protein